MELDARDVRPGAALLLGYGLLLPFLPDGAGVTCPLRAATGVPCPLCGMSTSVAAAVRLRLDDALAANPAGVAAVLFALAVLARPPRVVRVPLALVAAAALVMWLFELRRFGLV